MQPMLEGLRRHRRRWLVAAGVLVVGAGAALALYLAVIRAPGDISNPGVEFSPEPAKPKKRAERFKWPFFGRTKRRTHFLDVPLRPPFRRLWARGGRGYIERAPTMANGTLFLVRVSGTLTAISAKSGKVRWRRRIGRRSTISPTYSRGKLFVPSIAKRLTALNARTGKKVWTRRLPYGSESAPVIVGKRGYLGMGEEAGSGLGAVTAFRVRDGKRLWTHRTADTVTASPSYARGTLYVGDYAGNMTALRARDGKQVWRTSTSGASFGRSGDFYGAAAVTNGRVFAGSTDGRVYSFSARTGKVAWAKGTGNYVYPSPAVADVKGAPPTVFIGSFNGTFFALDARSGKTRWTFNSGGDILGTATVIGRIVYFSDHGRKRTYGLDARNGRVRFRFPDGYYNAVISDGKRLYLSGAGVQYALVPKRKKTSGSDGGGERRPRRERGRR